MMSKKNFVSFGDSETIFAEVAYELAKRKKIFIGNWDQWNSLTTDQKISFDKASIQDLTTSTQSYPGNLVSFNNEGSGLSSHNVEAAIKELEQNFQDGVDDIYDAVVAKGSTPASHSLSDVVAGIGNILTPSGTLAITANSNSINVSQYATVSVNVPNSNSATFTANSRASSIDMGATNNYRYVNTSGVPNNNTETFAATTRSASINMGATNEYRYVDTTGVPNSNTETYTFASGSTGAKTDLGATNKYRYVNAANVYAQGKKDLSITKQYYVYAEINNDWLAQFFFQVKVANGAVSVTLRSTDYMIMSVNAAAHSSGWYTQYKSNATVYQIKETSY